MCSEGCEMAGGDMAWNVSGEAPATDLESCELARGQEGEKVRHAALSGGYRLCSGFAEDPHGTAHAGRRWVIVRRAVPKPPLSMWTWYGPRGRVGRMRNLGTRFG